VDRDGEGGAVLGGVGRHHHRQLQFIQAIAEHRHADDAGRMPQHEADLFRAGVLAGEDQIAFVLPVAVVDHDHHVAVGDRCHELVDWCEVSHSRAPSRRSTYLASTSTSTLSASPGSRLPNVVTDNVCGMSATSRPDSSTSATVRLTPSSVIEPFSTM